MADELAKLTEDYKIDLGFIDANIDKLDKKIENIVEKHKEEITNAKKEKAAEKEKRRARTARYEKEARAATKRKAAPSANFRKNL